jgi:hypothetical protein
VRSRQGNLKIVIVKLQPTWLVVLNCMKNVVESALSCCCTSAIREVNTRRNNLFHTRNYLDNIFTAVQTAQVCSVSGLGLWTRKFSCTEDNGLFIAWH